MEQLLRIQLPYCNRLHAHPSLDSIKALKLGSGMTSRETLQLVARSILQLEHLDLRISHTYTNDLELLYPLKQLSSLRLNFVYEGYADGYWPIHDCEGKNLLNILSRLNKTNPLRNLEFASEFYFSVHNVMQYLRLFTHLETFYCAVDVDVDVEAISDHFFCKKIEYLLLEIDSDNNSELQRRPMRVFRFQVDQYDQYSSNKQNDLVFMCDKYGKTSYYLAPCDYWPYSWRIRSFVLRDIMEKALGARTIFIILSLMNFLKVEKSGLLVYQSLKKKRSPKIIAAGWGRDNSGSTTTHLKYTQLNHTLEKCVGGAPTQFCAYEKDRRSYQDPKDLLCREEIVVVEQFITRNKNRSSQEIRSQLNSSSMEHPKFKLCHKKNFFCTETVMKCGDKQPKLGNNQVGSAIVNDKNMTMEGIETGNSWAKDKNSRCILMPNYIWVLYVFILEDVTKKQLILM
uniref:Uncharacterized protein n=1 Tax=Ditylenchus dipsaci TaxID=166011 RepID=A0A915EGQ5_9BILA